MNVLKKSVLALVAAASIGLGLVVPANAAPVAPALAVTAKAPKMEANDEGASFGINESYVKLATLYTPVKNTKIYLEVGKNGPAKGSKTMDLKTGMMLFRVKNINKTWGGYSGGSDTVWAARNAHLKKLTFGHAQAVRKTVGKSQDFKTSVGKLAKGKTVIVTNLQLKGHTMTMDGWVKTADLKGKSIGRYVTVRASKVYDDDPFQIGKRLAGVKKGTKVEVQKTITAKIAGKKVKVAVLTTGNYIPLKDLKKTGSFVSKLK